MAPIVSCSSLLFCFICTFGFPRQRICRAIRPCLGFWGLFLQRGQIALASEEESKQESSVSAIHCEGKWKFRFCKEEYARLPTFALDECAYSLFPLWHQCTNMRPYPDYELHNSLGSQGRFHFIRSEGFVCLWCETPMLWSAYKQRGLTVLNMSKKAAQKERERECWWSQLGVGHICSLPDSRQFICGQWQQSSLVETDEMRSSFSPEFLMKLSKGPQTLWGPKDLGSLPV